MSKEKKLLTEALLNEFEVIEKIEWLSENVILITLKYLRNTQIFLADPTKEKVEEKIKELLQREVGVFLEPNKYVIESLEKVRVQKEEFEKNN